MAIQLAPIGEGDVRRVGAFLHTSMNQRVTAEAWARSFDVPWTVKKPNNGFMLLDGDTIVGVYTAYYSDQTFGDRVEPVCNLGAWCVLPAYRLHGVRLLKALLDQPGYHFVDLSPSGSVVPVNERLGFRFLDTTTALVPTLPWAWRSGSRRITARPAAIESALGGAELQRYRDHARSPAVHHVLLTDRERPCYVVFRMDRRKQLPPVFASVLHVGDPEVFQRMVRPFAGYLLARHRALALLVELRLVGSKPRFSAMLKSPRRKMFLSPTLGPADVGYLYSELVSVPW